MTQSPVRRSCLPCIVCVGHTADIDAAHTLIGILLFSIATGDHDNNGMHTTILMAQCYAPKSNDHINNNRYSTRRKTFTTLFWCYESSSASEIEKQQQQQQQQRRKNSSDKDVNREETTFIVVAAADITFISEKDARKLP